MAGVQEQGFYVLASTNAPEHIDTALLQPQRLGIRVYCGLPEQQARLRILEMHTPSVTPEGAPLFPSPDVRQIILSYIARNTESFPPRQLGKIATNAKSILLERVAQQLRKARGLSEKDLNGLTFTVDDWEEALAKTFETFDLPSTVKRDGEIRDFVTNKRDAVGFVTIPKRHKKSFEEVRRLVAARDSNAYS